MLGFENQAVAQGFSRKEPGMAKKLCLPHVRPHSPGAHTLCGNYS